MGGPGLAIKHLWMRVPMTEFPHTTNFIACGGYRPEIGFCRFLWLRNSGWPRQAFSPFFTALAASPTTELASKGDNDRPPPKMTQGGNDLCLLLLTGCRLREILKLRWEEFDRERGMLFLPDSKTGRKPVILSGAALAILEGLPCAGEYVIVGQRPGRARHDLKRPWEAIRRHAGLRPIRLHDLRHSFAATGAASNLGLPIIGKLLGHKRAETTSRYAHIAADPLKIAADAIASQLAAKFRPPDIADFHG